MIPFIGVGSLIGAVVFIVRIFSKKRSGESIKPPLIGLAVCAALLFAMVAVDSSNAPETLTDTRDTQESSNIIETVDSQNAEPESESDAPQDIGETPDEIITLIAGEQGEYGKEIIVNDGTEFREDYYGYFVPGGNYIATNIGAYPTQISVYDPDGLRKTEEGWEEFAIFGDILLLAVGESGSVTIPDGWFIELHEPARLTLTRANTD